MPFEDETPDTINDTRQGRPNILMIFSDEHHWQMSGYAGHDIVETPHLDKLAASGVNFSNAYCNSPLCSPSRQSFMAGLHCHRIGMWNNVTNMPENTVTWGHALHAAGYETILCGKMHFNGYQKMYGLDRRPIREGNNSGGEFYSWGYRTSHEWTKSDQRTGKGPRNGNITEGGPDSDERQPMFQHDKRVAETTMDVLREKAADKDGQPWALCCGMMLPHPPFKARKDLWEKYKDRADLPFNMYGEGLSECDRSIREYQRLEKNEYTEEEVKALRAAYFGLIEEFDEYVGQLMACLQETGLAENTVVFYFSDHGEMACEHGFIGKVTLRESSVRVPMLASWPGHWPEGVTVDKPVSLVDLYPTFLDIANYQLPEVLPLDGNSLLPLVEGRPEDFKGLGVFGEFEGEGWNHPRAWLREGEFKYIYSHTADPELYNVIEDYYEMNNLAGQAEFAEVEAQLREKLLADWNPEQIEIEVLRTQARQKLAPVRNVCKDLGI